MQRRTYRASAPAVFSTRRAQRGFSKMPGRIRNSFLICLVLLFATSMVAEVKVLKNFTLIDGTGREPVAHAAMILKDGRIEWVGSDARLKIPPSSEVIDLQGKYVMPG